MNALESAEESGMVSEGYPHNGTEAGSGSAISKLSIDRRKLLAVGGAGLLGGFAITRLITDTEPGFSGNPDNGSTKSQLAMDSDNSDAVVENPGRDTFEPTPTTEPTAEQDIIRIEDIPRENLFGEEMSPAEVTDALDMDAQEDGIDEGARAIFEVPVEKVLVNGEIDANAAFKEVFERINYALRVSLDESRIEKFLNVPNGRQLFVEEATAHDERITQLIGGHSDAERRSGQVRRMNLFDVINTGHRAVAGHYYDNATTPNPIDRTLNYAPNIDIGSIREWGPPSNNRYYAVAMVHINNIMPAENPPTTTIKKDTEGQMILNVEDRGDLKPIYRLSTDNPNIETSPFHKI